MSLVDLSELDPPFRAPLCATPEQAALLEWAHANPIVKPRPSVENARYVLPDPVTGADKKWTRVTAFCDQVEDANFSAWGESLLVRGLTLDAELWELAQATEDRKALEPIAAAAARQGGRWIDADVGTALHTATEHHDLGTGILPPSPWDAHVAAWHQALAKHGIEILTDWMERAVINPVADTAGTLDRLAKLPDGRIVVLDIKTGSGVRKIGYAAQAAIYARSTHAWTPDGYEPLPNVDQEVALIAHLPAKGEGCEILTVDIARGWAAAERNIALRASRSVAGIFTRLGPNDDPVQVGELLPALEASLRARGANPDQPNCGDELAARAAEARGRIKALAGDEDAKATIARGWPDDCPRRPPWTASQLDAIELLLHQVDGQESSFLGSPDPELVAKREAKLAAEFFTPPEPTILDREHEPGDPMGDEDGEALRKAAQRLPQEIQDRLAAWQAEAKRGGRPWGSLRPPTTRTHAIVVAAIRCATHLTDDDDYPDALTRGALAVVIGDDLQTTWSTGAVLGSLTIAEANYLDELAAAFAAGDPETVRALGLAADLTQPESSEQ